MIFLAFWVNYLTRYGVDGPRVDVNAEEYVDLYSAANTFSMAMRLASFIMLMQIFKIFTFMSLSRRLSLLWRTLRAAAEDLAAVIIVLGLLVAGFAFLASIIFGPFIQEYHTVVSSLSAVLRCLLGDFDYAKMSQVAPESAPIFFTTYMVLVWAIIINAFVATLSYYNEQVQNDAQAQVKRQDVTIDFNVGQHLWRGCQNLVYYLSRCTAVCRCSCLLPSKVRSTTLGHAVVEMAHVSEFRATMSRSLSTAADHNDASKWQEAAARTGVGATDYHHEREYLKDKQLEELFKTVQERVLTMHKRNLFEMVERLHQQAAGRNVYVSVDELAMFGVSRAEADRIVTLFFESKDVYSVGLVTRRISPDAPNVFRVHKINQYGRLQRRLLVVDVANHCLRNCHPKTMVQLRQLEFSDMLQLETTIHDDSRLDVTFRGNGCVKLKFQSAAQLERVVEMLLAAAPGGVGTAAPEDEHNRVGEGVVRRRGVHHVSHEASIRQLLREDQGESQSMKRWGAALRKVRADNAKPSMASVAQQAMAQAHLQSPGTRRADTLPPAPAAHGSGTSTANTGALDRRVTALASQQTELRGMLVQVLEGQRRMEQLFGQRQGQQQQKLL